MLPFKQVSIQSTQLPIAEVTKHEQWSIEVRTRSKQAGGCDVPSLVSGPEVRQPTLGGCIGLTSMLLQSLLGH